MKQNKTKGISLLASLALAAELTLLLDVVFVWNERALSIPKFAALYLALFLLTFLPRFAPKKKAILAAGLLAVVVLPLLVILSCWYSVSSNVVYHAVEDGKAQLYGGQRVMLLVPHQDDDINVLGGVMEEYVKYGSEVYVVFSTNGDYYDLAEQRYREAITALGRVGIPKEQILFLGYGDQWNPDGPHLYNAEPGQVMTSFIGRQETYGTQAKAAYREGNPYTVDSFLADVEAVILEYLPDVIYCVDYDYNIDHRALSLGFEKVMGRILNTQQDYRPMVFKGFAYNSAWASEKDFYEENLLSTKNVFEMPEDPLPGVFRWGDRVRLPVQGESLSRSVISAKNYKVLSDYASQNANMRSDRIINSDKVFWQRQTESLCYGATVTTSSSNPELLRDFMLLESRDLKGNGDFPYDGVWIPAETDGEKQVRVTFSEPQRVDTIVLYDHPDREHNVLNACISFDDGTSLETGPLDAGGAAMVFPVDKTNVTSFSVALLDTQGQAGLTEIEAFGPEVAKLPGYGKLMDGAGNFVYDYWIDPSGEQDFFLYTHGVDAQTVTYTVDNPDCRVTRRGEGIRVTCPTGEGCVVSAVDENGDVLDSVYIQNPGTLERRWKMFWLRGEEKFMNLCETKLLYDRLFLCRVYGKLSLMLRPLF